MTLRVLDQSGELQKSAELRTLLRMMRRLLPLKDSATCDIKEQGAEVEVEVEPAAHSRLV